MAKKDLKKNIDDKSIDSENSYKILKKSKYFDAKWYRKNYKISGDPYNHYLNEGYLLGYNPSPSFSAIKYDLIYDDVRYVKANPVIHYEKYGSYEENFTSDIYISDKEQNELDKIKQQQDRLIKRKYSSDTENLIVFLVPEMDLVSGGVMSINSIAKVSASLKNVHNSEVIVCTMPNPKTFIKYTKFKSDFDIFRFEQLRNYFKKLKNVIIHIPEIYVYPFLYFISPDEQIWLQSIQNLQINILNQNIDFLPRPRLVEYLKRFSSKVTMTCAHRKYTVPQLRTSFDIDVHFLSTSNFTKYTYVPYEKKDDILVYSPDLHPMKEQILDSVSKKFPNLKLIEINNLTYSEYLELISRAKYMITFGEGLDGYFLESIRSGTMAFSVYNLNFFDESFDNLPNVFDDYSTMLNNITKFMDEYDNAKKYNGLVKKIIDIDKVQYNDDEYVENIKNFYLGNYTYPLSDVLDLRRKRVDSKPLISIAMATYNGEKYLDKQIQSILNLDYDNIEIIVSDDNSTDGTMKILNKYKKHIKIFKNNKNKGLVGNFVNAIKHCSGEYIALSDQDDIWEKNKLNILLERIDDFDIIQSGVSIIDKNDDYHPNKGMHIAYEIDKTTKYKIEDNVVESFLLGCSSLIRTDFLKKYLDIPKECIYHDMWFAYNAIVHGKGIVYIDEQLIKYRQHGDNTAFKTYNSDSWKDKKIVFDKYMINSFEGIDKKIKKIFELDINYNILNHALSKYFTNDAYGFCNSNFLKMDIHSMRGFIKTLDEDQKKFL